MDCTYIQYSVRDKITYPFPHFNGANIKVWEWISYFIPYFKGWLLIHAEIEINPYKQNEPQGTARWILIIDTQYVNTSSTAPVWPHKLPIIITNSPVYCCINSGGVCHYNHRCPNTFVKRESRNVKLDTIFTHRLWLKCLYQRLCSTLYSIRILAFLPFGSSTQMPRNVVPKSALKIRHACS